ncbi:hypothetical protein BZM27_41420 [Paraburkholderia steynii]|uniref:Uncharacterized protein n=1 Tax=Paraburkholderia steynii TaxID=1245441 RepID=A0A4R0X2S9_9BURK|nr:hypothetical protein BZM27_41420 [Paraburkholderia steynii]
MSGSFVQIVAGGGIASGTTVRSLGTVTVSSGGGRARNDGQRRQADHRVRRRQRDAHSLVGRCRLGHGHGPVGPISSGASQTVLSGGTAQRDDRGGRPEHR